MTIRLQAGPITMHGNAPIEVDVVADRGDFAVSRFLQVTTGIAFEVRSLAGDVVSPLAPIMGSPPPPPLVSDELTVVTAAMPFRVHTHERSGNVFPGLGTYRVRALLVLFDTTTTPVRYARIWSDPITVHVTD